MYVILVSLKPRLSYEIGATICAALDLDGLESTYDSLVVKTRANLI